MTQDSSTFLLIVEPLGGELAAAFGRRGFQAIRWQPERPLAELLARGIELAVVDTRMKGSVEIVRQLRELGRGQALPIVVMGGSGSEISSLHVAIDFGADSFVDADEGIDACLVKAEILLGAQILAGTSRPYLPGSPEPRTQSLSGRSVAVDASENTVTMPHDPALLDSFVAPSLERHEAIDAALAVAETMAPSFQHKASLPVIESQAVDSSSLREVIEAVERSLEPPATAPDRQKSEMLEEIESLNFELQIGAAEPGALPPEPPGAPINISASSAASEEISTSMTVRRLIRAEDLMPREAEAEEEEAGIEPNYLAQISGWRREAQREPIIDAPPPLPGIEPEPEVHAPSADTRPSHPPPREKPQEPDDFSPAASAIAPSSLPPERFFGSLSVQPFFELLRQIYAERQSGVLVVSSDGAARRFALGDGAILSATSTAKEERLAELLYREGRLDERSYAQAVAALGPVERRAAWLLAELGLIAPREIFPLVRHSYEQIVLSCFALEEGSFRLESDKTAVEEHVLLDVPIPVLIFSGIGSRAPASHVDRLIPCGCRPAMTGAPLALSVFGALGRELEIFERCDGARTTHVLARQFGMSERELRRILAAFAANGLVVAAAPSASTILPSMPPFSRPAAPDGLLLDTAVERDRVADKLAQVREGSYFTILELLPSASDAEIRRGYRSLVRQFALERFQSPELSDLLPSVERILEVIEEAYEILRDADRREQYRQAAQQWL